MDSQSRAFEASLDAGLSGTPLPCVRRMRPQPVVVWTPARILGALFGLILSVPRAAVMAPALVRPTRNRRA